MPEVRVGKQNVFNYFTTSAQHLCVCVCVRVIEYTCVCVCVCNETACNNKTLLKPAIVKQKTKLISYANETKEGKTKGDKAESERNWNELETHLDR